MKLRSVRTNPLNNSTPHRKYVLAMRMAAWNAVFIIAVLLLIALVGETYFRLTRPFIETSIPYQFVDGVGVIREPNAELRYADWNNDNFVVSRVNSQGFLDREPISAERAPAGCHIAFIGDSFVEALEVPIADKFHVRLEEMAARELPHLGITTQAYGITGTGQINQIPFYDEYASRLNPDLVILVFFFNDFANNITAAQALNYGADPDRMPFMSAHRDEYGALKLYLPDSEYERFLLPRLQNSWYESTWKRLVRVSYFAKWLDAKGLIWVDNLGRQSGEWANMMSEYPCCEWLQDVRLWLPGIDFFSIRDSFLAEDLPPVLEESLEYTEFGIDQFKRRADRDTARLMILSATAKMGLRGDPQFDRMSAIAEAHDIPVISDYDYIVSQGSKDLGNRLDSTVCRRSWERCYRDWRNDWEGRLDWATHWDAIGHQWAAEAVLEWLMANQDVCD